MFFFLLGGGGGGVGVGGRGVGGGGGVGGWGVGGGGSLEMYVHEISTFEVMRHFATIHLIQMGCIL